MPLTAQTGELEVVQMLIDADVSANDKATISFHLYIFNMEFPGPGIHVAAARGIIDIISLIIEHGAYVNLDFGEEQTLLQHAQVEGNEEIVQMLLAAGAE